MSVRLDIVALGHRGEGIARHEGRTVHVPFALPGERVEAELAGDRGFLAAVITAAAERIAPFCPHFGRCGGCATQHLAPGAYAAWKHALVAGILDKAGIAAPVQPLVPAAGAGRRRVTLHVRYAGTGRAMQAQAGFMALRSHTLIDLDACPVLVPALARAPTLARAIGNVLKGRGKPLDVQVTATLAGLDVDVRGSGPPSERERLALAALVQEHDLARLTAHGALVLELRPPRLAMGPGDVVPPPGGFLQATEAGEEALGVLVKAGAAGSRRIVDLFCGIGPFSLRLATAASVTGFDSAAPAIAALQRAVAHTRGLKPVTATVRDLFRRPLTPKELGAYDCAVLDPPRAGAEAQMRELAASPIRRVVSVSCDPVSFARDALILLAGGFRLEGVTPVDQFAHTPHIELVGVFTR